MRAPPPVEYPSALTRTWRALLALFAGAGIASLVAWAAPHLAAYCAGARRDALLERLADPTMAGALALSFGAAAALAVGLSWKSDPAAGRMLRWDGQHWLLPADARGRAEQRGDVHLMLDLGPWLLVRFLPHAGMGSPAWLPLTAGVDPARWAALRGALWNWRVGQGNARP